MTLNLSLLEVRILASLIEKALTTPEYYPLTLNSLIAACCQKSNREPVMQIADTEVLQALDSLRDKKLVWSVMQAGSRVAKYRHSLTDVVPLSPQQVAVICELMLRGPQTCGELRIHASRMCPFSDTTETQSVVQQLLDWPDGPLVTLAPRRSGQREERYAQILSGPLSEEPLPEQNEPLRLTLSADQERFTALEERIKTLEAQVANLHAQFTDFLRQF